MNFPLVTIGIPVYNEEKFLAETIASAQKQSYKFLKILISDNASTDSSYQIALQHAKTDSNIEVFKHEINIGAIENFKFLLSKCSTKYFMWLGGHDLILENLIKDAIDQLENDKNIVVVYPKTVLYINNKPTEISSDSEINTRGLTTEERILKVAKNLSSCMAIHGLYRTEILKKIPFKVYAGDFLVILLANTFGASVPANVVSYYRREVRIETEEERLKRLESYKFIKNRKDNFLLLSTLLKLQYVYKYCNLSFRKRLSLIAQLKYILNLRFAGFSWFKLLKYSLFKQFDLKFATSTFIIICHNYLKRNK
jgi:glycosyltransferase involved in cell wall biosynthesis